jgi:pyruvate,water dikinase
MELSMPQPAEDPSWLDDQLANLAKTDVTTLLEDQVERREVALNDYAQKFPKELGKLKKKLAKTAEFARGREAVRSEFTRTMNLMRQFALRAGQLTGQEDNVFFLSIEELTALLNGNEETAVSASSRQLISEIPARRQAYETFCALPPYPAIINGRFDPIAWAENPDRRTDIFDAHPNPADSGATTHVNGVTGFPGSAGVVEGVVRVLHDLEESDQLQPGEILVAVTTNIGWTPVFPRVTAVVTDVGAPLSHAAIVARELGIPAVVGCGNATMRLHTGDRVRVDGAQGTITMLSVVETSVG